MAEPVSLVGRPVAASGPAPFEPALRPDVVENRALHLEFCDPRSSVSCAAVTLRARFTL